MASSSGEEPRTSQIVPNATSMVTMEAKMVVATGHDHCQQLKDMLNKADPSTMEVVMSSDNQTSTAPKPRSPVMDPRLLAAACSGSWQKLQSFLNEQDRQISSDGAIGSSAMQPASGDVEALRWESFLDGVTTDGDTFLHVMATNSDGENLEEDGPIRRKSVSLLFVKNINDDTPLHCAARAGNSKIVSFLIDLARGEGRDTSRVKALLEMENKSKWTVLHEAVRGGNNDIVELLMEEDPELTNLPKTGTSPLYLAILLGKKIIAETLHEKSSGKSGSNKGNLSYSGPNGQNALHAAVLRGQDLTKMLLEWNDALMLQQDENGRTPLHLAASLPFPRDARDGRHQRATRLLLLKANPHALYQTDNGGSFPIHVAASVGTAHAVSGFLKESPTCAGLRDARGRTFLHVAVEKEKMWTVRSACSKRSLSWILNMQDKDGNTALHLAVQTGNLMSFCALLRNIQVQLNLANGKGETPLDIAYRNNPTGIRLYIRSNEANIHHALRLAGAKWGICRQGYLEEKDIVQTRQDETRKMDEVKEGTQSLAIGSVLIATVTFGATFAMPGGYRADDHTNGGTPTLAGRYTFDLFTVANALAFTFSTIATICLMISGSPLYSLRNRTMHLSNAFLCMSVSLISLVPAFALGTYTMLAPVAPKTAVAVCVLSSLVLAYQNLELAVRQSFLMPAVCQRRGLRYVIVWRFPLAALTFVCAILINLWPIVIIFCLTALIHTSGKVELAAQPPTPLA